MSRIIPGPYDPAEMRCFLDTFLYADEAVLVDAITRLDRNAHVIEASFDTTRRLPFAALQRTDANHPPHVAAGELLMITGSLGCLHAWFFHGCRWNEGWAGFGSRIYRAEFKRLARVGEPLELESRETRQRAGPRRVVLRYEFRFRQNGQLVYFGDQAAMFLKNQNLT